MASNYPSYGATKELRIVLVGKTGSGKSASGNTILGYEAFESEMSPTSVTDECSKAKVTVDGQDVVIIDTPGLFDTRHGVNKTCRSISQCITYASPGPHVFLIVIGLGRFTAEEKQTVEQIQELFGQAADRYSMVLLTRGDELNGTAIEPFIAKSPDLQELVARCQGQYHVFNNKLKTGPQVTELLQKIRNIVKWNEGGHYTSEMFQEAERIINEEKQRILIQNEAKMRIEREQLRKEMKAEYEEQLKNLKEHYQAGWNELKREGERFINAKVEKEMERHRENQTMELVVANQHQDVGQMQNMFMMLNMQNNQYMMAMQNQQQQFKLELERQRDDAARKDRELDKAQWETEKAKLEAWYEKELYAREKALQEKHEREAREKAEKRNAGKSDFRRLFKIVRGFFGCLFP